MLKSCDVKAIYMIEIQSIQITWVFVDEKLENIFQIDLVPTLSSLLNIPIPMSSLGVSVTSLLSAFMSPSELLHAVMANCNQLMQLINKNGTAAISGMKEWNFGYYLWYYTITWTYFLCTESFVIHSCTWFRILFCVFWQPLLTCGDFHFFPEQSHPKHKLLQSQYESYRRSGEENSERINKLVSSFIHLMTEIRDNHAASLVDYDISAMIAGLIMTATVSQQLNMHV